MIDKDALEAHFWKLFDGLSCRRFRKFAEIDMKTWRLLERYREDERQTRPLSRDKLLLMREKLLRNLDAWERAQGRKPII